MKPIKVEVEQDSLERWYRLIQDALEPNVKFTGDLVDMRSEAYHHRTEILKTLRKDIEDVVTPF